LLDIDFIIENPEAVRRAIEVKGSSLNLDELLALHTEMKATLQQVEALRAERNRVSKETASAAPDERQPLIERSRAIGEQLKDVEPLLREQEQRLRDLLLRVPNIPAEDEPVGPGEEDNAVHHTWGQPPSFAFQPRDHVELVEMHDWADIGRSGKIAGPRTYMLKGDLVQMEMAIWRMAIDLLQQRGFTAISVPSLVKEEALVGTGHFPSAVEDVYYLPNDDLYLSGTSEVSLNFLHSGEILAEDELPKAYAGFSLCFRREAGAAGRDVRGLFRVHQFYKVEQYVMCPADHEESHRWFARLLDNAETLVQALELPYRVVRTSTGEMGTGKVRMWDIECWLPSQERYRETHSVSELYDWQARRADLRYREAGGKIRYTFTLNNTAVATPRLLIPLLENHQQADGSVRVPEKLRPYLDGRDVLGASS
jgi:seryl-tRNA synthetase